jgi:hypothetical protein
MGGTSTQQQQQTSTTSPYAPAQGTLDSILGQLNTQVPNSNLTSTETGALDTLKSNAQAGNPYAGAIGNAATSLLNGGGAQTNDGPISNNLTNYQGLLSPYASGSMVGNNPALKAQLDQISSDVSGDVNGQFAAAGRDGSAYNQQALARGIAQGEAPVIADQYNQDVQNQLNAANSLYGAGNTTYGLLNQNQQTANANQQAGVDVGSAALDANNYGANQLLAEEAQRRGIPLSSLTTLLGSVSPVAQAFGTNNSTSNGSSTESGAQQFGQIAGGIGGLLKFIPSDRRLKEDIRQVGTLFDGTPVYRYRYKSSPAFQIGLIAQDVEQRTPGAVTEIGGLKAVDYHKATQQSAQMETA